MASRDNLAQAAYLASRGKRHRPEVREFLDQLEARITLLREEIMEERVRIGEGRRFRIFDPKPREIFAPCFRERVLHHALMIHVGPVLDGALTDNSFACRVGKGSLAATWRVREYVRRFAWYAKMDVRSYFASIRHSILMDRLRRKLKGDQVLDLIERIVVAHEGARGRGLPIGALTSQCFANFYLDPLDRFLLKECRVKGYVQYMDDFIFWTDSRAGVDRVARLIPPFLERTLALTLKPNSQMNRSERGVTFCGYRILPQSIRMGRRRKRRFLDAGRRCESAYLSGELDAEGLQRAFDAALAITAHADRRAWLRARMRESYGKVRMDQV